MKHQRHYDFSQPLDDCWELICDPGWTCDLSPGCAHWVSTFDSPEKSAEIYLRPCFIDGDTLELGLVPGAPRRGVLVVGLISGFEFINLELCFATGELKVLTHEFHKQQPRLVTRVPVDFTNLKLLRQPDNLPHLPYGGAAVTLLLDGKAVARVGEIDFLPESLAKLGLKGAGEVSLSHLSIYGGPRPRPEYVTVGVWQCRIKPTTAENVDSLITGVREAAEAGVQILLTPETSLTGLRPFTDPEMRDDRLTQAQLERFQKAVSQIKGAPYTVVGYPDWIPGSEVEGATIERVRVNCHRFVRPDGTLGPRMAKVHSCEDGMWHGRHYNCQRVAGVEVALGVCHDGHYKDVWATGVMAGARLCLHASAGGDLSGNIPDLVKGCAALGTNLDAFWLSVNAGGGGAIVYPVKNRKVPETVLAVTKDLSEANPTYPKYSAAPDSLAHARIRLWDATGCYPLRTLRAGKRAYELWSKLMPRVQEVG